MTAKPDDPDAPYPKIIRFSRTALANQLQMLFEAPGRFAGDSQPGSPNDRDRSARHGAHHAVRANQRRLWERAVDYARHAVLNVYDHGDTLLKCISGDSVPLYTHYTNARVMLEASASIRYVLDPTISYEQRVTRGAAIMLESSDYELKRIAVQSATIRAMWGDMKQQERKQLDGIIDRAGIVRLGKGRLQLNAEQPVAIKRNFSGLVEKYHRPSNPGMYSFLSGAVHSSPFVLSSITGRSDATTIDARADMGGIGTAVLQGIEAIGSAVGAFAEYFGHTGAAEAAATKRRVDGLTGLIGAEIRSQIDEQLAAGRSLPPGWPV